jgi:hypothetical protein
MNIDLRAANICMFVLAVVAPSSYGAERMRAGQWNATTIAGDRTFSSSSCLSQRDVDAINGDANTIRPYLETIIPPNICKITDVKVVGNQILYTASCSGAAPRVVTTSYHGDSSESTDSIGTKTIAKLVGSCK